MTQLFRPDGRTTLIGSMPLTDHDEAHRLVMENAPDVPVWVQLPAFPEEGMIRQFLPGMPGLKISDDRIRVDAAGDDFSQALVEFYEEYMNVTEAGADMDATRFALRKPDAPGFFVFRDGLMALPQAPAAVKGQVTGPITLATGTKDMEDRAIFYDLQARDAAVKLLALKAKWQVQELSTRGCPVIIFIDEPALAGFGTSEFISISREEVLECLREVIGAIHSAGGLAAIHVCANTEWDLIIDSGVDVINFDAYGYFDKLVLYADPLKKFLENGGILAWGLVPTGDPEAIDRETVDSLYDMWRDQRDRAAKLGLTPETVRSQALITPSCGVGSLSPERAMRVLELTRGLSERIRAEG